MYCENCGKTGFTQQEMSADPASRKFIGPCCVDANTGRYTQMSPSPANKPVYGLEFHSDKGLFAYLKVGDLTLSYNKSVRREEPRCPPMFQRPTAQA